MKTSTECFEIADRLTRQMKVSFDPTYLELSRAWRLVGQWAALDERVADHDSLWRRDARPDDHGDGSVEGRA